MSRFAAMPQAPRFGVSEWEVRILDAMRQNVELLVNQRREADQASVAVLESTYDFSTTLRPTLLQRYTAQQLYQFQSLDAKIFGVPANFAAVWWDLSLQTTGFNTTLADNTVSKATMNAVGSDVRALRATVNEIVTRLRG